MTRLRFANLAGSASLSRHCDRRQQIEWNSEKPCDLLMQFERAFAVAGFQVRQIVLCDSNCHSEFGLGLLAKLAQHPYWIFTIRKPIDDVLRQHRCTTDDLSPRPRNQPCAL